MFKKASQMIKMRRNGSYNASSQKKELKKAIPKNSIGSVDRVPMFDLNEGILHKFNTHNAKNSSM